MSQPPSVIGLDIGKARVGVARALWPDGIAVPLTVLDNDSALGPELKRLAEEEGSVIIVAGLPRSLNGGETAQTAYTLEVVEKLKRDLAQTIYLQDEAATSLKAEAELGARKKPYSKKDIDSLSAVYILEDFLAAHPKGRGIIDA